MNISDIIHIYKKENMALAEKIMLISSTQGFSDSKINE